MHTLFEPTAAAEIISRIQKLQPTSQPQWGKMNVAQMMAHCQAPIEIFFSEKKMKRNLIGILFGKMVKKKLMSEKPWDKNLPTAKEFKIVDQKDFETEKEKLVHIVTRFSNEGYSVLSFTHPFFGKMSSQEWGVIGYNHLNHHLTQFGV